MRVGQVATKEGFLLLDGDDLKELGFLLGPRKQLLEWSRAERQKEMSSSSTPSSHSATTSTSIELPPATPSCSMAWQFPVSSLSVAHQGLGKIKVNINKY